MAKDVHIHWQAPTTVVLALVVGIVFAAGHHLFYSSLNGKPAPNSGYNILGSQVSQQQLNIAGGTAFAFLVKASLVTALTTAYAQLFWRAVLHRSREVTLERLDTAFSVLSNVHYLMKAWIWWRYPTLFSIALVAWLIPLASIVTPATLSIASAPVIPPPTDLRHVPNVDFVNLNYVDYMTPAVFDEDATLNPNEPVEYFYTGPSRAVKNVAQAVAAEGSILSLTPPDPNTRWSLEFPGPALRCSNMSDSLRFSVQSNILKAMHPDKSSCQAFGFLAWTPAWTANGTLQTPPVPFTKQTNGSYTLNSGTLNSIYASAPAAVYLAAFPNMMASYSYGYHGLLEACQHGMDNPSSRQGFFANSTMIQCELYNATYSTTFEFQNGEQNIDITSNTHDDPLTTVYGTFGPPSHPSPGSKAASPSCNTLSYNSTERCSFNQTLVSMLSYQAILEAFNGLFVGSVYAVLDSFAPQISTGVHDTILVDTPELKYLTESIVTGSQTDEINLQESVMASNGTLFQGLLSNTSTVLRKSVAQVMEEMFQNITVSMMSSRKLKPNLASAFAPPPANVTFLAHQNIYTYSPAKLWIAYGLAIFFSACASILGLLAIFTSHASYSLTFSSVFRASRRAIVNVDLKDRDMDIQDPLSSHLANAKLSLAGPVHEQSNGGVQARSSVVRVRNTGPSSSLLGRDAEGTNVRPRSAY